MNNLTLDEAIEIVEKFNQENRYRDGGKVNNAIDEILTAAKELKKRNEISSMSINEYTTADKLFEFIRTQMKYDEVMKLYKLFKKDIEGPSTKQYFKPGEDFETSVKIFDPKEYRKAAETWAKESK